jgi:cell division protein FtsN
MLYNKMHKIVLSTALIACLISCRSLKDSGSSSFSDSDSPYVKEEPKIKPVVKKKTPIVVKEEKVNVIEANTDNTAKFYVIIGSFQVLNNAKKYKTSLTDEGFIPIILKNEKGLYRISVASYNDEENARTKVDAIRNQYEKYNDTWLLIRKM